MEKFILPDFCFFRTPAYSINVLNHFLDSDDVENKGDRLREIFKDSNIQTALHSSTSTEFFSEFQKWLKGLKTSKENTRLEETLTKYLVRMTTRSIPFALFSGFSLADMGLNTSFQLADIDDNISHLRLDMEYIQDIIYHLQADPAVLEVIKFYPNSSLYRIGDKFKYVEYSTETYVRKYNHAAVDFEEYLDMIFREADLGATLSELIQVLTVYDNEISTDEARDFIGQLISSQLLVSELESNVTGKDNLVNIIDLLDRCPIKNQYLDTLKEIQAYISTKKYTIENSDHIKKIVEKIIGPKDHWSILQSDLEIGTQNNSINKKVIEVIVDQIQNLSPLALGIDRPDLKNFKEQFLSRYDTQEIPMMEALDPEMGIGYANLGIDNSNTLLKDVVFNKNQNSSALSLKQDSLAELVMEKYLEFLRNDLTKIVLLDSDLIKLKKDIDRTLPDSFFIHGSLLANSTDDLDKNNFTFHLKHFSGPPSCLTIGRFCYTSEKLTGKVKAFLKEEEKMNPDAIYAEIVHLTDSRVGNVTIRPHLRDYEIPYLGKSDLERERLIAVSDIMISIRNNRIKLRSKRLGKEIIPRLTNAHVFTESRLPVYKFLGEVQRDKGGDWLSWHWYNLKDQKYLPRVEYKNIVLKPARWQIFKDDLEVNGQGERRQLSLKDLMSRLSLPRYVSFSEEGDKDFIVDTNSEISSQFVLNKILKNGSIVLEEYLQTEENCWISDTNDNKFTSSVMIPVVKEKANLPLITAKIQSVGSAISIQRKFFFGSQWTYFKIYAGRQNAEDILREYLPQYIEKFTKERHILSWHYIRYSDPDFHLRVRIKTPPNSFHIISDLSEMFNSLKSANIIQKLQLDTYEREIERYGSNTMEESEHIFFLDSYACLSFIKLLKDFEELNDRWLWCIRAIHTFLNSFDYSLVERHELLTSLEAHFGKVNNCDNVTFKQINTKYRKHEQDIRDVLSEDIKGKKLTKLIHKSERILTTRDKSLKMLALEIKSKIKSHNEVKLDDVVGSYIHLFVNRLFISNANRSELLIYIFLNKYYLSQIKRNKV